MTKVDSLLADYAFYHQTRGNMACHFIGIPLIVFSLLAMLRSASLYGSFTVAEALIVLSLIYYVTLDIRLAFTMLVGTAALDCVAWLWAAWQIGIAAFVLGWIFQAIGHAVYEKRSPAFTRNLVHLLIGPIFLINEAFHIRKLAV